MPCHAGPDNVSLLHPLRPDRRSHQRGTSLVELACAMVLISIGALCTLSTMLTSSALDEELRERATALEAAAGVLEAIRCFDYGTDIQNLQNHWSDPANAVFEVPGLPPRFAGSPGSGVTQLPQGAVQVDSSDPERIRFMVQVSWRARRGDRSITLSSVHTEVER